jgi:ectoine hydroxylase
MYRRITEQERREFEENGFVIIKDLFCKEEVDALLRTAKSDHAISQHAHDLDDGSGGKSKLTAWFKPGDNVYGMFARCPRVVQNMKTLLGCDVYHYHSKMMLKEPFTGGAWAWHQDYGYWYHAGYLFPEMASCLVAVDRATKENGCIQMLKGSHKMGRIEHVTTGDQTGAESERMKWALGRFELVYCESEPGTAVFFHGNTLHASAQNKSPNPRWSLICCYTGTHNTPLNEPQHPGYEPIHLVDDDAILRAVGMELHADSSFLEKDTKGTYSKSGT